MRQAGKLKQRVTIQRATEALDALGSATKTWSDLGDRWAQVFAKAGQETTGASQIKALYFYTVKIRASLSVLNTDRIVYKGKVLEILSINNAAREEDTLELLCRETE